jgi:CubicO group peptidase (beta-lactamase class C family)
LNSGHRLALSASDLSSCRSVKSWWKAAGGAAAGGFTGTGMWISPKQQRWAILLTNKLYYNRDRQPLTDIRDTFRELVFT